jgi:hypothetical protein
MIEASRIWTPGVGQGATTPLQTGAGRALIGAFPVVVNDALPERMREALLALADREPVTVEDRQLGSAR